MASPTPPDSGKPAPGKPSVPPAAAKPGPVIPKPAIPKPTNPQPGAPMAAAQAATTATAAVAEIAAPSRSVVSGLVGQTPAWAVSMLVHVIVLLSMALVVNEIPKQEAPRMITASAPEIEESFEEFEEELPQEDPSPQQDMTDLVALPESSTVETVQVISTADDLDAAPITVELTDFGTETAQASDLLSSVGVVGGKTAGGLGGRTDTKMRQQLIQAGGGSSQSEAAVESSLKWIVQHQMPDGGWSFNLKACPSCNGQCSQGVDKGYGLDRCGATSMALLPFLGRGYTHKDGPYKKQFEAGIGFLATMAMKGQGKAYGPGGNLYSQGLAGIVLSESYAMTQDRRLAVPAQAALNYIMAAQDPAGGGWRYSPKQPGDTSAVGWQLMALKSGHMAFLQVSPFTIKKSVEFLNAVQADDGATYGYTDPGNGGATSAVGLLCRMYLGWKKDHPALQRGVDRLAKMGPSNDLYFDYYATQVLHHVEGDRWVGWNTRMRDMLVTTQSKKGHEAGSWYEGVDGGHGAHAAGRLYCTSLATLILEVYYRHLPIYGQGSVDEDFKE
jgi:hypothetical protein